MLTLTAKELFESFPALAALVGQKIRAARIAYNLSKTWKAFQAEAETLRAQEESLFKEYGGKETVLENGAKAVTVDFDQMNEAARGAFDRKRNELHEIPVEIWGTPLTIEQIEAAGLELSGADFLALSWLIADEADEVKTKGATA